MRILHLYPVRTTPQIAVWVDDMQGDFGETLYVTERYATQSWRRTPGEDTPADGVRRIEALPCWTHRHGVSFDNGSPAPTRSTPLPDAITEASPKGDFTLHSTIETVADSVMIYVEINNSGDFNDYYSRNARKGDSGYTGGKFGSGQPALVYGAMVRPRNHGDKVQFTLLGHSSPDGSDGAIHNDLSAITTAHYIVEDITVLVR